jgi:hypothetical protein
MRLELEFEFEQRGRRRLRGHHIGIEHRRRRVERLVRVQRRLHPGSADQSSG